MTDVMCCEWCDSGDEVRDHRTWIRVRRSHDVVYMVSELSVSRVACSVASPLY